MHPDGDMKAHEERVLERENNEIAEHVSEIRRIATGARALGLRYMAMRLEEHAQAIFDIIAR